MQNCGKNLKISCGIFLKIFMNNQQLFEIIALDLKRVALGYAQHSEKMTEMFRKNALQQAENIDSSKLTPKLFKLVRSMQKDISKNDSEKIPDDALMYSFLLLSFSKTL